MKILYREPCDTFTLLADSSLSRNRLPLFVPDNCLDGTLSIAPAIRIGRLGKTISSRFATRYIDGFTLVARLRPKEPYHADALDSAFDSAMVTGDWFTFDPAMLTAIHKVSGTLDTEFTLPGNAAEQLIERCSSRCMLKMGDIITLGDIISTPINPLSDKRFEAHLDGLTALSFKVK